MKVPNLKNYEKGKMSAGHPLKKGHFCLIGYRGAGKSTLFKLLKKRFSKRAGRSHLFVNEGDFVGEFPEFRFFSLDEICKISMGETIESAVSKKGWSFFRQVERDQLKRLLNGKNISLIDCGGGIVEDHQNCLLLKQKSWVIFIDTQLDLLVDRQLKNPRISLDTNNPYNDRNLEESIRRETKSNLKKRLPLYKDCADFTLRSGEEKFDELFFFIFEKSLEIVESENRSSVKHGRR